MGQASFQGQTSFALTPRIRTVSVSRWHRLHFCDMHDIFSRKEHISPI